MAEPTEFLEPAELFKLAAVRPPTLAAGRASVIQLEASEPPEDEEDPTPPVVTDPVTGLLLDLEPTSDDDNENYRIPLSGIDGLLGANDDHVNPDPILRLVRQATGRPLRQVIKDPRWRLRKAWLTWAVQTALAADRPVGKGEFREANGWVRGLRVMTLLELLAADTDTREETDDQPEGTAEPSAEPHEVDGEGPEDQPLRVLPARRLSHLPARHRANGRSVAQPGGQPGRPGGPGGSGAPGSTGGPGNLPSGRDPNGTGGSALDADAVREFLRYSVVQLPHDIPPKPANVLARPPAVSDLKVVKLGPPRYVPGAIAHIENVLQGEIRRRKHALHEENEQTTTTETERTEETEKDLNTASNVAMQHMAMETLSSSSDVEAGVNISASYGPTVSVELSGSLARHDSREATTQAAQSLSNEITQSAREKVIQRTREERVTRRLITTDELNLHGFDNTGGEAHIRGVYRYVNQVQEAWLENYGKRLMPEFIVPQASRLLRWAFDKQPSANDVGQPPAKPKVNDNAPNPLTPDEITPDNYLALTGKYGAVNVTAPPPPSVDLGVSFKTEGHSDELPLFADHSSVTVPDGYEAVSWSAQATAWDSGGVDNAWLVGVGQDGDPVEGPKTIPRSVNGAFARREKSKIPVIMLGRGLIGFAASVTVHCDRTSDALATWKLKVFDAIMSAWRAEREEWEARKLAADARARAEAITAPITGGANPEQNRATERRELRRCVITMLTGSEPDQGAYGGDAYSDDGPDGRPKINNAVVAMKSPAVQFFEQAFEWSNMTYVHYPYYWAAGDQWAKALNTTATDPLWEAFLSSGATRVVVPVRPGCEATVSLFLATGVLWLGGQVPTVGDPAYLGIADEVAETLGTGTVEPETTPLDPVVLPTPLIWLQGSEDLNPTPEEMAGMAAVDQDEDADETGREARDRPGPSTPELARPGPELAPA